MTAPGIGVAVQVAGMCLQADGRLDPTYAAEFAARGALLVDLALAGRLRETSAAIEVDPVPTGSRPGDVLSAAMVNRPGRSLREWIQDAPVGLRDVADELVRCSRWSRRGGLLPFVGRPRYAGRLPAVDPLVRELIEGREGMRSTGLPPVAAAAAAIARGGGLTGRVLAVPDELVAAAGEGAWVTRVVLEHLAEFFTWRTWGVLMN